MGHLGAQPILSKPNLVRTYLDTWFVCQNHMSGDVRLVSTPILNVQPKQVAFIISIIFTHCSIYILLLYGSNTVILLFFRLKTHHIRICNGCMFILVLACLRNTKDIQQNAKKSFLGISIWTRRTCLIKKPASSIFRVALSLEEANT